MIRTLRYLAPILGLAALTGAPVGAQTVASTFASTTEGWTVNGFAYSGHLGGIGAGIAATLDGANGQPPGSLRVGDVFGETCVQAPAAFLGDMSADYGGTLSFDILLRYTDGVDYPALMLVGAAHTLFYVMPSPPLDTWLTRSVPLTEAGWRVDGVSGTAATQADLLTVLGSLQKLLINTEWKTGTDDTNVDNVVLAPSPGSPWTNLGSAFAGITGKPVLVGTGSLVSGTPGSLLLANARPLTPAILFISIASTPVPVKGGVLLAFPELLTLSLATSAAGTLPLPFTWPAGVPSGTPLTFQYVIKDAAALKGVALSNAVRGLTP